VVSTSQEAQELGVKGRRHTQLAQLELPKVEKLDEDEADSVQEEAVCVVVVVAEDVVGQEMAMLRLPLLRQLLLLRPLLEQVFCRWYSRCRVVYELQ